MDLVSELIGGAEGGDLGASTSAVLFAVSDGAVATDAANAAATTALASSATPAAAKTAIAEAQSPEAKAALAEARSGQRRMSRMEQIGTEAEGIGT